MGDKLCFKAALSTFFASLINSLGLFSILITSNFYTFQVAAITLSQPKLALYKVSVKVSPTFVKEHSGVIADPYGSTSLFKDNTKCNFFIALEKIKLISIY